ncbi:MAG: hypothetical protein ABSG89_04335 [Bacteroidales bacterium]|jgi:hypothetical protein
MRGNENLQKVVQKVIKCEPSMNADGISVDAKFRRYLKRFIFIASLAGIGLFFNSCMSGYVATEPAYSVYARPPQPSSAHIWIDGDWGWNSQTHVYVQNAGYWEQPRQGQRYVSGSWKTTPRGKTWLKGRWQSTSRQKKNQSR